MPTAQIKLVAIKMIYDVDSVLIKIFHSLFEHAIEEDGEESQCQDATLLHSVGDQKVYEKSLLHSGSWIITLRNLGDS